MWSAAKILGLYYLIHLIGGGEDVFSANDKRFSLSMINKLFILTAEVKRNKLIEKMGKG